MIYYVKLAIYSYIIKSVSLKIYVLNTYVYKSDYVMIYINLYKNIVVIFDYRINLECLLKT